MPEFAYKARNAQGGLVEGVLSCADRSVAIRQIEQQNCIPIRIEAVAVSSANASALGRTAQSVAKPRAFVPKVFNRAANERPEIPAQTLKIPHSQLLVFTEQLAHL